METLYPLSDDKNNQLDILVPIISFDHKMFLKNYYKISDASDFYIWLNNNKNAPVFTKLRLMDCFIISFGSNISVVDEVFAEAILDVIRKFWIKKIYNKLCQYVGFKNDKVAFVSSDENKLSKSEQITERTKFLMNNLMTKKNIFELSNNYFSQMSNNEKNSIEDLLIFLIRELEIKIQKII